MRAPAHSRLHRGFSLLEMILAIGLSAGLIVGAFSAIDMYWRMEATGRQAAERTQVVRAVIRAIELDIRSCAFRPSEEESSAEESEGEMGSELSGLSGGELGGIEEELSIDASPSASNSTTAAARPTGLIGTEDRLLLHIVRPQPRLGTLDSTSTTAPAQPTTDLQSVAYFLGGTTGVPIGVGAAGESPSPTSTPGGLARMVGDQFLMQTADATGDLESLGGQTQILAPEVEFIGFRYFDGWQWLPAWDSTVQNRLPRAVEVTLRFGSPETAESNIGVMDLPPALADYRVVVALPSAEPSEEVQP